MFGMRCLKNNNNNSLLRNWINVWFSELLKFKIFPFNKDMYRTISYVIILTVRYITLWTIHNSPHDWLLFVRKNTEILVKNSPSGNKLSVKNNILRTVEYCQCGKKFIVRYITVCSVHYCLYRRILSTR